MDFDEYVVARRGRLVEHAVSLGCAEDHAPALVDEVLAAERRRIGRAEDPDPEVREALERAVDGTPGRGRWRLVAGIALGALLLTGVMIVLLPDPAPTVTMPSYFGFSAPQAQDALEKAGFVVSVRESRACEPQQLVLATVPPAGVRVRAGSTVVVRSAVASGAACVSVYGARSDAWEFVRWVRGGAAPAFATTVNVVVDGREPRSVYLGDSSARRPWGDILTTLAADFAAPAQTRTGLPRLVVLSGVPPDTQCGVPRPPQGGDRASLRLQVEPLRDAPTPCPLTIDLFRSGSGIDSVVVYSAQPADDAG